MKTKMERIECIENALGRWNPADLAYLERFDLTTPRSGRPGLTLTALFQRRDAGRSWPDDLAPFYRIRLYFDNVRNLSLKSFGQTPQQVMGFDICDVSERELEEIRFSVGDYENDTLAFECSDIHVLDVEPLP